MNSPGPHPESADISIIAELENVRSGDRALPFEMLDEVLRQSEGRPGAVEVIVMYDDREFDEVFIRDLVVKRQAAMPDRINVRAVSVHTDSYVDLKNQGVKESHGRFLVFIDGDVVPQPGWLDNLLAPFQDPGIDVVAGHTRVGPLNTFFHRAFALFWIFEFDPPSDDLTETDVFVANNFAVRKEVLRANPFPPSKAYRAQAAQHARFLRDKGHRIVSQPHARILHAPPRAFWMRRAVWHGHDMAQVHKGTKDPRASLLLGPFVIGASFFKNSVRRILTGFRKVGMPIREVPAALVMAAVYDALKLVGFVGARLAPRLLRWAIPPP